MESSTKKVVQELQETTEAGRVPLLEALSYLYPCIVRNSFFSSCQKSSEFEFRSSSRVGKCKHQVMCSATKKKVKAYLYCLCSNFCATGKKMRNSKGNCLEPLEKNQGMTGK